MLDYLLAQQLTGIPDIGSICCILLLVAIFGICILSFVFKLLIEFLPATVLAIVVYFVTGSWLYALLTFGVIAFIMFIVEKSRD